MGKLSIGLAIGAALLLVSFGLVARAAQPTMQGPHLAAMAESAQALQRDGAVMMAHGQAMLAEGQRTGDQDLTARGEHWLQDGRALVQRGQWLLMNPTAPSSLVSSPGELAAEGSWGELTRTAQAMLQDPTRAREVDLQALRWNGLAMRAEGQNMAEHGQVMAEEVEVMLARHGLEAQTAAELRQAARTMREVGGHLAQNGQAMLDYAEQLRRSMGFR
jgi:hypothetical protein